jgi:hypothetical protein
MIDSQPDLNSSGALPKKHARCIRNQILVLLHSAIARYYQLIALLVIVVEVARYVFVVSIAHEFGSILAPVFFT